MSRHTIVLEFDSTEPKYSAGMEILGGRVVAVAFADELARIERLENQRDVLLDALEEIERLNEQGHEISLIATSKVQGEQ